MPGTGGVNVERGGAEIWWETGDVAEGTPVTIKAVNAVDGDVGIALDGNDGYHFLTWPPGTWHDTVTVFETENPENVIAEFEINVKVSG